MKCVKFYRVSKKIYLQFYPVKKILEKIYKMDEFGQKAICTQNEYVSRLTRAFALINMILKKVLHLNSS